MINLWMEGYIVTGESEPAKYCGIYDVDTIQEAVALWIDEDLERDKYVVNERDYSSYWGRQFYDNEADARKHFG